MKMRKFMGGRDLVQDLTPAQIRAAGRKAGETLLKMKNDDMVSVYSGEKKVRGPLENPMPRRKMPKGCFGMVAVVKNMDAQFREMPEMVSQEWLVAHSQNPNHGKAKFRRTSIKFQQ
jgi:hypothetical protein